MSDVMRLMQIELDARRDKIRKQEQTIAQQAQELEMNYRAKEQQVAQLQATLAAREAAILQQAKQADSNYEVYEMAKHQRDAAVQEAGRLKFWVSRLLNDLPTSRDWLDPVIEQNLRGPHVPA